MNLVDTPGCQDTDIEDRINNLYKLHSYFKQEGNQQKQFKFIFLVSEPDLNSKRGQEIRILMEELFQLFQNIESFQDSVLVIFSKVRPYQLDSEDYQDNIQQLREDFLKNLMYNQGDQKSQGNFTRVQQFFESVNKNNFLTFSKPGSKNECNIVKAEKDTILHILKDKIQSVNKVELNTQHQLDAQVKVFVKEKFDCFQALKEETNKLIFNYLITKIVEEAELKQESKTQKLQQERQNLTKFENYKALLHQIQCSPQKINELEKLHLFLDMYNNLQQDFKDQFDLNKIKFIDQITNQTFEQLDGQTLTLKAFYLHSSEMDEKILKKYSSSNLKKLILIIEHAFIFDSKSFSFHGGQLALKCKKFIISQYAEKIDLSGQRNNNINYQFKQKSAKNGEDGKDQQDGKEGEDGLPGNPGENGGYFLLSIENVSGIISKNKNILKVDVSGGQGYDGQNGGNGGKGGKGKSGDLLGISQRNECYLHFVQEITGACKDILSLNKQYLLYYQSRGEKGFKGGNGGKGGSGGFQGNHGGFKIVSWNENQIHSSLIQEIKRVELKGIDGKCGQAGYGGEGGENANGIYKDEFICPRLRGIASKMSEFKQNKTNDFIDKLKEYEGTAANYYVNGAIAITSLASGEAAVSAGIVTLARFIALPVGITLSTVQGLVSTYMAMNGNGFIDGPQFRGRAENGDKGIQNQSLNIKNLKYPDKTNFSFRELIKHVQQSQ